MSENSLYGWFEDIGPIPAYDPPHNAPCPYCGDELVADDVRTHSFMAADGRPERFYFYRTHRTCDETATEGAKQSIFSAVIERVTLVEGKQP